MFVYRNAIISIISESNIGKQTIYTLPQTIIVNCYKTSQVKAGAREFKRPGKARPLFPTKDDFD